MMRLTWESRRGGNTARGRTVLLSPPREARRSSDGDRRCLPFEPPMHWRLDVHKTWKLIEMFCNIPPRTAAHWEC